MSVRHAAATDTVRRRELARPGSVAATILVVLTRRNLIHILREPMQLSDVTIQPVLFTLLFIYVFGPGILSRAAATPSSPWPACWR